MEYTNLLDAAHLARFQPPYQITNKQGGIDQTNMFSQPNEKLSKAERRRFNIDRIPLFSTHPKYGSFSRSGVFWRRRWNYKSKY
jgi:hypothetical protein